MNLEYILNFTLSFLGSFLILTFEPNYIDTLGLIFIALSRLVALRNIIK